MQGTTKVKGNKGSNTMKIGIFGGSFDPIHYGHLLLAEFCREAVGLDKVRFIPSGTSPLKPDGASVSSVNRVEMLRIAIAGYEKFEIDECELKRGGTSYTIDTLRHLKAELPDAQLYLLVGADIVPEFAKWKEPAEIMSIARPVIMTRGGHTKPDLRQIECFVSDDDELAPMSIEMPQLEISSSSIRRRAADGRSIRFQTPRAVEQFIVTQSLYGSAAAK